MENPDQTRMTSVVLLAGQRPDGQLIYEEVYGEPVGDNCYRLATSPVFARGAARGDIIRLLVAGRFEVEEHGGNLCVRVLAREGMEALRQQLDISLQGTGTELDYQNERTLVYSVPVKTGFEAVEAIFNKAMEGREAQWLYANVYDPVDGEPLDWWLDYLAK